MRSHPRPGDPAVVENGTRAGREAWDEAPCGLLTAARDGTVLDVNRTLLRWTGRRHEDVAGRVRVGDLFSVGGRIFWETHLFPLLRVEGGVEEVAVELEGAGGRVPVLLSAVGTAREDPAMHLVLAPAGGRARFERELVVARAEADRAVSRLRGLQHVTAALSGAVGVQAVAAALTDAVRAGLGATGVDLRLDDAAQRSTRPGPTPDTADREPTAVDGTTVRIPLHGQFQRQGVLTLTFGAGPGADVPDLDLLATVGQQSGLALDRARHHDQRSGIAYELQRSLLAGDLPQDPRYAVATTYLPAVASLDVGGDWYDVFRSTTAGRPAVSLAVGDVVGHGLHAAVGMGQLRSALRAVSGPDAGPAAVLSALDRFAEQVEVATTATVALAQLDLDDGRVRYACAGHLPPLLLPARGAPRLLWEGRSTPLGITVGGRRRPEGEVLLEPGDALLLYTDGLVERRSRGLDTGLELLVSAVARLGGLSPAETVHALARTLLVDQDNEDDVCLLLLRWLGGPPARTDSADPAARTADGSAPAES